MDVRQVVKQVESEKEVDDLALLLLLRCSFCVIRFGFLIRNLFQRTLLTLLEMKIKLAMQLIV